MRIVYLLVMLSSFAVVWVSYDDSEQGIKPILWHARVKASDLKNHADWNPAKMDECPLQVDDAVRLAINALEVDFPSVSPNRACITCKLSVIQSPEIEQDLPGRMILLYPRFWQIEFLLPAPVNTYYDPIVDVRYIVLFDGTIIRPKPASR